VSRECRKPVERGKFDTTVDRVDPQLLVDGSQKIRKLEERDGNTALLSDDRMQRRRRRTDSPPIFELDREEALVILIYEGVEKIEGDPTDHATRIS
jgi:hypothetical protein